MNFELWLAFTAASMALMLIPGPTVLLVVSNALNHGKSSGYATVPGVALGDFTAMTASLLGAGVILSTSATLFSVMKLVGAAYLIWIGIQLWRSKPELGDLVDVSRQKSMSSMFWNAYIVTALNPKGIVFFIAFVPQFIDTSRSILQQSIILTGTFVFLAAFNVACWAFLAGTMRQFFKRASTLQILNKVGASFLIGGGVITALIGEQSD